MPIDSNAHNCPSCNAVLAADLSVLECGWCHAQFTRDQAGNILGFRLAGASEAASAGIAFIRHAAAAILVAASAILFLIGLVLSFAPPAIAGVLCAAIAVGVWSARGPWSAAVGVVLAVVVVAVLVGIYALIGTAIHSK